MSFIDWLILITAAVGALGAFTFLTLGFLGLRLFVRWLCAPQELSTE